MILKQFSYKENMNVNNSWTLNDFTLNDKVNLLVGKNAVGKTRTINRIAVLAGMIKGQVQLSLEIINSADFDMEFSADPYSYKYSLRTKNRNIDSEIFSIDGDEKLRRNSDGSGFIYYENERKNFDFHATDNNPIVTYRRDALQHPYLENLHKWASELRCYYFGSSRDMGQNNVLATVNMEEFSLDEVNILESFRINELFINAKKEFGKIFTDIIINYMQEIGYEISSLAIEKNPYTAITVDDKSTIYMLCVKEQDRNAPTYQTAMSQGMFRALSLLIQITYSIMIGVSSTILIDDIGEGLDFDRSTKLIELLINIAEHSNIQLIMTTNDRYVMNKVPFKYWQLIDRKGEVCKIYNYQNAKDIFDEFKFTGLNNFDFLATDFINSERIL